MIEIDESLEHQKAHDLLLSQIWKQDHRDMTFNSELDKVGQQMKKFHRYQMSLMNEEYVMYDGEKPIIQNCRIIDSHIHEGMLLFSVLPENGEDIDDLVEISYSAVLQDYPENHYVKWCQDFYENFRK